MRKATIVLNIIRDRGKHGLPINNAYRLLYQKELYLLAYAKLYSNKGALTQGSTKDTADGMSVRRIDQLIDQLRQERYRWSAVRRIYIPKRDGQKLRPLGMPGWDDKLLQEVIRLILEAYYEPLFSDASHGFRPKRGCHTALQRIKDKGKGSKWFIEGDIRACFDKIEFSVLLNILQKTFKDNRFITLIKRMLNAGYMEDWVYNKTYSGVPQGGICSPILANLVLDQLDKYVEGVLIPEFNKGAVRKMNPEYKRLSVQKWRAAIKGNKAEVLQHRKTMIKMSSKMDDPEYRRLWYVRYADDWMAGVIGTKAETIKIKEKIAVYLRDELKLELNEEKTLVTHAATEKARFLGYHVSAARIESHKTKGRRSVNGQIGLHIPREVIREYLSKYMRKGKPEVRPEHLKNEPFTIISEYQAIYRGIVEYYKMAYNIHQMNYLKYAMVTSLIKTLANKYRISCLKVIKKYRKTINTINGQYVVFQEIVHRGGGKKPLETHFGGIPLMREGRKPIIDQKEYHSIWNHRSELIDRLLAEQCELCGKKENVEVHHIRKLADIIKKGKEERAEWKVRMAARRRKTLIVCNQCHNTIHSGKYDGPSLKRKSIGEPRDMKVSCGVR